MISQPPALTPWLKTRLLSENRGFFAGVNLRPFGSDFYAASFLSSLSFLRSGGGL